ncbi:MAG: DUF924 family protein [Pseudomonadota bacterium]
MNETTTDLVLAFWFDEIGPERWFETDPALDDLCRSRLGDATAAASVGQLQHWARDMRGVLALLVLLDQMPRNIYRGAAQAFASDARALAVAKGAIARGFDTRLSARERPLLYLPLMHSERLADQARCVALSLTRLPEGHETARFAILHRDVIRHFGRFPSRNTALGRTYSAAEAAYRDAGGFMG